MRVVLRHPVSRETLDTCLAVFFPGPASYTGEDVVEYHLHGGRAVIDGVLKALGSLSGLRLAMPGEFTRRAFEEGKIDLTEAEAVADLIAAETEHQKIQALGQMGGVLTSLYQGWGERITRVLAHLEAALDFPDESLPEGLADSVISTIKALRDEIGHHLDDGRRGERLREGIRVTLLGPPNAGKSTLFNLLAQRDVAIVSPIAGTTRDVLEVLLDLGGFPVVLSDTAGLRSCDLSDDPHQSLEQEGMRRALQRASESDFKILVFDASALPYLDPEMCALVRPDSFVVFNKSDLGSGILPVIHGAAPLKISAKTGEGVEVLIQDITDRLASHFVSRETPALTRTRHREALECCAACLGRSLNAPLAELVAEELRLASRALGQIMGRVDVEDLLDVIFRDFCIGK